MLKSNKMRNSIDKRVGLSGDKICPCGKAGQDVKHYLLECEDVKSWAECHACVATTLATRTVNSGKHRLDKQTGSLACEKILIFGQVMTKNRQKNDQKQ